MSGNGRSFRTKSLVVSFPGAAHVAGEGNTFAAGQVNRMSPFFRLLISICICCFASANAWAGPRTVGYFCANCLDFDSARQQAMQYAAPLQCNSEQVFIDPNTELACSAEDRRVILGNHLTGQVFSFLVSRGNKFPWLTTANAVALNATETEVYQTILDLRVDWENALKEGMTIEPELEQGLQTEGGSCPSGTALDFVTEIGGQSTIKNLITGVISSNLDDYRDKRPWYKSGFGVGLTILGTGGHLQFPEGIDEGKSRYIVEFPISEADRPPFSDILVYNLELIGNTSGGEAVLTIDFLPAASRVAGFRMDELFSGNVEITDECVLEKLGRMDDIGGNRQIRLGGTPLDPNNTFGTGGSSGATPGGGNTTKMCIFEFWVDGDLKNKWTAPCESADGDKEEIQP